MKTIKVKPWGKDQGDHVVINEPDYDPKVHELLDEADDSDKPSKGLTVDQIRDALKAKGIELSLIHI